MKNNLFIFAIFLFLFACKENPPIQVEEEPAPEFYIARSAGTISLGNSISFTFHVTRGNVDHYLWGLDNPNVPNKLNGSSLTLSPIEAKNYTLYVVAVSSSGKRSETKSSVFTVGPAIVGGVTLQSNARKVSSSDLMVVTNRTDNSISFQTPSEDVLNLKVGEVIYGYIPGDPNSPILRKITSIQKANNPQGAITFLTSFVPLSALIGQGKIDMNLNLFNYSPGSKTWVVYDADGNTSTTQDQIQAYYSPNLNASLKGYLEFSNNLKANLSLGLSGSLDANVFVFEQLNVSKERTIFQNKFGPFVAGPLVAVVDFEVYLRAESSIGGAFYTGAFGNIDFNTSINYNGSWSYDDNLEISFQPKPSSSFATGNIKLIAGVRLSVLFYEVAGPSAGVKPYIEYDYNSSSAPPSNLYAGLDGELGVKTGWFAPGIPSKYWTITGPRYLIKSWGSTNNQPPVLNWVVPENGQTNVDTIQNIGWNFTDPEGDNLTYDFYFGKINPPPLKHSNMNENVYIPWPVYEEGTKYYWKVVAKDGYNETSTGVLNFTTGSFGGGGGGGEDTTGTFIDPRDGKTYKIVKIGNQWWFAENFAYDSPNSVYYDNDPSNAEYGRLYSWDDAKNYAPSGWHLPSLSEIDELVNFLGGKEIAGGKLKEEGTEHWNSPNIGATNESGFSARGSGFYRKDCSTCEPFFASKKVIALFWTSTTNYPRASFYSLANDSKKVFFGWGDISGGNDFWKFYSVSYIKD
jgi:uncharacterized protein (TIGR02145 family)